MADAKIATEGLSLRVVRRGRLSMCAFDTNMCAKPWASVSGRPQETSTWVLPVRVCQVAALKERLRAQWRGWRRVRLHATINTTWRIMGSTTGCTVGGPFLSTFRGATERAIECATENTAGSRNSNTIGSAVEEPAKKPTPMCISLSRACVVSSRGI